MQEDDERARAGMRLPDQHSMRVEKCLRLWCPCGRGHTVFDRVGCDCKGATRVMHQCG